MAVTPQQIAEAEARRDAADQKIKAADAALAALANDPDGFPGGPKHAAATAAVTSAKAEFSRERIAVNTLRTQYDKENPKPKAPTPLAPGAATVDAGKAKDEAEKDANAASIGLRLTNAERAKWERDGRPKPDSSVEVANSNTRAGELAETQRSNQSREELDRIKAQRDALTSAGTLANNLRDQISREAGKDVDVKLEGIKQVRGAGESLVDAHVRQRDQNVRLQTARMTFIQDVLTTAMPKVADMLVNLPKGDPSARNFMLSFLAMARDAYNAGGLGVDPAELDQNSPVMQNLKKIAGMKIDDQLPTMPSSDQITFRTTRQSAAMGMPLPGWQGPIGPKALEVPDNISGPSGGQGFTNRDSMPNGAGGGGPVDPLRAAAQSPEGQALEREIRGRVSSIEMRVRAGTATPEEQATLAAAKEEYKTKLKQIADAKRTAPATTDDPKQQLRNDLRETLVSGTDEQKVNIMSIAMVAQQNARAGKNLSDLERAVLENIDPEDLTHINKNMTPQVAQVLLEFGQGKKPTPEGKELVRGAINNVTTAVKTRQPQATAAPVKPTQPATAAGTPPSQPTAMNPDEIKTIPFTERIRQNEAELAQTTGDSELDDLMKKIDQEQRAYGLQTSFKDAYFGKSLREQAEERRKNPDAAMPTSLSGPTPPKSFLTDSGTQWGPQEEQKKIISDTNEPFPPDITGMFRGTSDERDVPMERYDASRSYNEELPDMPRDFSAIQNLPMRLNGGDNSPVDIWDGGGYGDTTEEEDPYSSSIFSGSSIPRFRF